MPVITSELKQLKWPKDKSISDTELVQQAKMQAYELQDDKSIDLTDRISFNHGAVNIHQLGEYQTIATVVDMQGQTAEYQVTITIVPPQTMPDSQSNNINQSTPPKDQPNSKKTRWLVVGGIVLVILLLVFGLHSCHNQREQAATNESQSSQISQNSQSIAKQQKQLDATKSQLTALKAAVKQYQQDQNEDILQNQLAELKAQNSELKAQAQTQLEQQRYYNLNRAIDQISSNPNSANSALKSVQNNAVYSEPWSDYLNSIERWVN